MSPDVFLSQNRIRTDNYGGFNGSPAEKVAALQSLNKLRAWNPDTNDFSYITYRTPGFGGSSPNPSQFSNTVLTNENAAYRDYQTALKTGDLDKVHQAVDVINAVRTVVGGAEFIPFADWDIVSEGRGPLNLVADFINTERRAVAETGFGTFVGSPLPWFDTKAAFDALNSYVAG